MTVKQRNIKPARDYAYGSAIIVQASAAISENDIVALDSFTGSTLTAKPADAGLLEVDWASTLFVAKHDIPSGSQGILLPWRVIDADTSGFSADDLLFLGNATAGSYVATVDANSNTQRVVGRVLTSSTTGKILLAPEWFASHPHSVGYLNIGSTAVVPHVVAANIAASGGTATATLPFDATLIDCYFLTTTGGTTENMTVANNGDVAITIATGTVIADDIVRATAIDRTYESYTAGDNIVFDLSGTTIAGTAYLTVLPA